MQDIVLIRLAVRVRTFTNIYFRCDIPFRGFSVHQQPHHNRAQIFLVNAVGDLFASTLSFSQNLQVRFLSTEISSYISHGGV